MTASNIDMPDVQLPLVHEVIFKPAYALLPPYMNSTQASALMMAIGLQESKFKYRSQLRIGQRHWWEWLFGPAKGWPQFETAGVHGVLHHHASRPHALHVLNVLQYPEDKGIIHKAIMHNDVLAACFARLLLWTDPRALPALNDPPQEWWYYYIRNWRPGKPKREPWDDHWFRAVQAMNYITRKDVEG